MLYSLFLCDIGQALLVTLVLVTAADATHEQHAHQLLIAQSLARSLHFICL